jgi:2-polyprenyl-6-methoxyphenol hydroxylase-like FAD-dependent oxidoreductase
VAQLCQSRCDVIILEQNNALYSEKHNGGLSLGPWGQQVFKRHILAQDLLNRSIRSQRLSIFSPDDDETALIQEAGGGLREFTQSVPEGNRVAMTTWAAVYQVLLRGIAVEFEKDWKTASEARPRIRISAKVENAQYEGGKWTITYRSSATNRVETETADMLVAADGGNSIIRRVTSSSAAPSYEGVVAWRGRVPDGVVVEKDDEIRKDLLVWYRMRSSQYIILWVFCLKYLEICSDD